MLRSSCWTRMRMRTKAELSASYRLRTLLPTGSLSTAAYLKHKLRQALSLTLLWMTRTTSSHHRQLRVRLGSEKRLKRTWILPPSLTSSGRRVELMNPEFCLHRARQEPRLSACMPCLHHRLGTRPHFKEIRFLLLCIHHTLMVGPHQPIRTSPCSFRLCPGRCLVLPVSPRTTRDGRSV